MSLEQYRAFAKVVEGGGFTAAAAALGVSKSLVSKHVRHLEDRLGVRLLDRTTRQVTVTDGGRMFYERVVEILASVDDAEAEVSACQATPRGMLRVSVPMSFGIRHLAPLVAEFAADNPLVSFDVDFDDRRVDLVAEGIDVAVRIGALPDSSLVARKLASMDGHTVASPAYLAAHGTPQHPSDLVSHQCLLYKLTSAGMQHRWTFRSRDGRDVSVRVTGRFLTNSGDASLQAALAGLGISPMPSFLCREAIADGRLVPVLEEWTVPSGAIWAVFPHNRHVSATVRAFVDFLAERLTDAMPG